MIAWRALPPMVLTVALVAAGCASGGRSPDVAHPTVNVLYAGSLAELMEQRVGPGFEAATGDGYAGFGAGSAELASDIAARARTGDVFISSSPAADEALRGPRGGGWVRWWSTFATAQLVVAYNPSSRYAAGFHSLPWYDVIGEPGIRIGRTDPKLDPKGELTVAALERAQRTYHLPGFARRVEAASQVFPEEQLLGQLSAGQLDAGFFYTVETVAAHLPSVTLGRVHLGASFTVTVLDRAPHPSAATAFVRYLLTAARRDLTAGGLRLLTPAVSGDRAAIPARLRSLVDG